MRLFHVAILGVALLATPALAKSVKDDAAKRGSDLAQKLNPFSRPALAHLTFANVAPYVVFASVFCAAGGLIGKAAFAKVELTNQEAMTVVATCFLPGLGPILVSQAFKRHPEWNRVHCLPLTRDAVDLMMISGVEPKCWEEK